MLSCLEALDRSLHLELTGHDQLGQTCPMGLPMQYEWLLREVIDEEYAYFLADNMIR